MLLFLSNVSLIGDDIVDVMWSRCEKSCNNKWNMNESKILKRNKSCNIYEKKKIRI